MYSTYSTLRRKEDSSVRPHSELHGGPEAGSIWPGWGEGESSFSPLVCRTMTRWPVRATQVRCPLHFWHNHSTLHDNPHRHYHNQSRMAVHRHCQFLPLPPLPSLPPPLPLLAIASRALDRQSTQNPLLSSYSPFRNPPLPRK